MLFKKIFSNTLAALVARVLFRAFNAFIAIIVARYLGVEKFGVYSTALALVNTFLIANDIGSTTLLQKKGSREPELMGLYFGNSIIIQLIASALFFALALAAGWLMGYDQTTILLVVLLGLATIIFEFRKSFRAILSILLKLKFIAFLEVLIGALSFGGVYILSKIVFDKDLGLILVAVIPLFFNLCFILSVFFYDLKFIKPKFDWKKIWPMIKEGYIYSIYSIFYTVYLQISTLMVQYMQGDEAAGLYSAAAKLVILILIIPQMIFQVGLPILFKYSHHDLEKYKRIHKFIFRYINALGIPVAVGLWLLPEQIINLIYHKSEYALAAAGLHIFAIFLLARFLGNISGQSLTAFEKQKKKVLVELCSLGLLIVMNYFLIKEYGFIGAALGTVLIEVIIRFSFVLMDFYYLKLNLVDYFKSLLSPWLAVIVMAIVVTFTKANLNVILVVILGAITYGVSLWIFRFFQAYDLKLFKQLIPSKFKK